MRRYHPPKDRPGDGIGGLALAGAIVLLGAAGHIVAALALFVALFFLAALWRTVEEGRRR